MCVIIFNIMHGQTNEYVYEFISTYLSRIYYAFVDGAYICMLYDIS